MPAHERNHLSEHADGSDKIPLGCAEVDVQLAAAGRAVFGHVLLEDFGRGAAHREDGAEIAQDWRGDVAHLGLERERAADGGAFLAHAAVEAADDLALRGQDTELLLDHAGEPHEVMDAMVLVSRKRRHKWVRS